MKDLQKDYKSEWHVWGDDRATSDESEIDMMYGHNVSKKGERAYVPVMWNALHFSSLIDK